MTNSNQIKQAKRISPELAEVLHMLKALEKQEPVAAQEIR